MRFAWSLHDPARERPRGPGDPREGLLLAPSEAEDATWEARPSVAAYAHALPAHPLGGVLQGRDTRLQSLRLALLDPDRLPAGYELLAPSLSLADGEEAAQRWMVLRERARECGGERRAVRDLRLRVNTAAVPAVLVPFRFRGIERGTVLVDALSGEARGEVAPDAGEVPSPGGPVPRTGGRPHLVPLECPECGEELALHERDRLFPCRNCAACWELVGVERRRVRQWFIDASSKGSGRWLPFWVYGSPSRAEAPPADAVFVPAYEGRHVEMQLHLAARITRRPPRGPWCAEPLELPEGAAVGHAEAQGWRWAVEGALARRNFADFIRFLDAAPADAAEPAGLVWLWFRRQGGDLIEPETGARTSAIGVEPWETRRAA